jgi:DNA-directed RNA polymerase omega subunit
MKRVLSRGTEINIENCVKNVGDNRFDLVLIASARSREISRQHKMSEDRTHIYPAVSALLDIQEGRIGTEYLKKVK